MRPVLEDNSATTRSFRQFDGDCRGRRLPTCSRKPPPLRDRERKHASRPSRYYDAGGPGSGLKPIDSGYRQTLGYAALAAFYAAADKAPEAKATLVEAMKLTPKLSVGWLDAHLSGFIDSPPGFREALIKAGLPEE